jgi:1-acyl-sn-glycerol-3-phosphate acyltransferase
VRLLARLAFYWLVVRPLLYLIIGLRVKGREHLETDEQVLIVSNHNSHLDTVVLLDLIGPMRMETFRPVAAADYFTTSSLTHYVTSLGFNILPIRRTKDGGGDDPLEVMAEALARGESLILFPEGTRGEPEQMTRFRSGAARLIARFPRLKVVPVYLDGLGRIMPRGEWYPVPLVGRVNIGAPRAFVGTPEDITRDLEDAVRALKRECRGEP